MILTKKELEIYLQNRRITISDDLNDELIEKFGKPVIDDEGHIFEYAEQDISEQMRKLINKTVEGGA